MSGPLEIIRQELPRFLQEDQAEGFRNVINAFIPQDLADIGLMAMTGPGGKFAKTLGGTLASLTYAPDAEAGLLIGPKGAARAGLTKIAELLKKEREAALAVGDTARLRQVTNKPKIWTGMDMLPRTYLPSNNVQLAKDLKPNEVRPLLNAVHGLPKEYIEAYPKVKDMKLFINSALGPEAGGRMEFFDTLHLNPSLLGTDRAREIILHELTHAATQSHFGENFAGGSTIPDAKRLIQDYKKLVKNANLSEPGSLKHANYKAQITEHPLYNWGDYANYSPYFSLDNNINKMAERVYLATPGEVEARLMEVVGDKPELLNLANPHSIDDYINPLYQLQIPRK